MSHRPAGTEHHPAALVLTSIGTGIALLSSAIALANRATVGRLPDVAAPAGAAVTVCIPARNEATRLPALIGDLRAQTGVPRMRVLILDDASTDDTGAAAVGAIAGDERFTVLRNEIEPCPGWTGKAATCARLAEHVDAPTLIFLDADVRLAPQAIAAAAAELHRRGVALLSPWPWQRTGSAAEAVVQPLLCWSWASTLPISMANRSSRPSTAVACGQFLVFDTAAYRAIGGHGAVAASPTEDLDIARVLRRNGFRTALVAAGQLAQTRMYCGATELEAGYTRWLWSAYGGSAGAGASVGAIAALAYWVPPLAAVAGSGMTRRAGLLGYSAAVAGRLLSCCLEAGGPIKATDVFAALAHPLSIGAYLGLWARSRSAHRRGELRWKDRPLPP
ncbi:glycosyltransferase family A protein [Nocardia sp. NPDC051463]|uniref:glycosyltransferase n=1 Tax=Nocardia sp. NPDC051463 TaxID=3154845 RepID=UPI00344F06C9